MSGQGDFVTNIVVRLEQTTEPTATTSFIGSGREARPEGRSLSESRRPRRRLNILVGRLLAQQRCTMICATFLLCYLFTCCTHLTVSSLEQQSLDSANSPASHHRTQSLDLESSAGSKLKHDGIELKHDNVHRLMSEQDLRRTFQVDSHDQVPEYEILKLTVNDDGSHLISPISDLGELTTSYNAASSSLTDSNNQQQSKLQNDATTTTSSGINSSKTTQTSLDASSQNARHERSAAAAPSLSNDEATNTQDRYKAAGEQHAARDSTQDAKVVESRRENEPERDATNQLESNPHHQHHHKRRRRSPDNDNDHDNNMRGAEADGKELDKLIVMKLSTFGKDFKLRLKRNVDFQQRIKDMKMFMAESTSDGQLRYTEIKNHRKQEPHKREVAANGGGDDTESSQSTPTNNAANIEPSSSSSEQQTLALDKSQAANGRPTTTKRSSTPDRSAQTNVWNIGSTYHDEDNLAALLIDHDKRTGQLQVDGTIGNDFVIKPMPKATIDALLVKQQLLKKQQEQSPRLDKLTGAASTESPTVSALDNSANNAHKTTEGVKPQPSTAGAGAGAGKKTAPAAQSSGRQQLERAIHMHDDDPHDDDEMFLDEDEAIELAQIQSSGANNLLPEQQLPNITSPRQPLSKAATERKWRKYRKLLAQTQVPKPGGSQTGQRARRHAEESLDQPGAQVLQVSHHIVYRQKPSAEGSSSEHQHSFMIAPGQQAAVDQLAANFGGALNLQRLQRRDVNDEMNGAAYDDDNMIERHDRSPLDDTDFLHDPMGGQFYLEPGTVTGVERAGYSDWSLVGGSSRRMLARPPYALNSTNFQGNATHPSISHNNTASTQHRRFRRHAAGRLAPPPGVNQRRKRQAPDTVWPEVLLVVDYDSFLLHGGDSRDVKRYFVSFWNGVDLRYKLLVHPHIRISLAGMIVAKDRDATPYLERNRLRAPNADAVDAAGALTDMGKYLYREDRLPTYDLAVVITKLDMCRRRYEGGRCNRGTAGFAYVGGACVVNKRLEKVNSVAIIEDSGGFSGIIVAAHEVGHLLGCVHDGSPPPSYLGGPGATHCPWEDGFIMSDLRHTERGFRWSQCSVEQFKHFLNGETATCLYNYPHESQMLHRLLPGTMLTLDEQCKRDRGTNACFKDARVCAQLFCFDSASGYCVSYRPAAEGSPCGEGQVCRNGKCVGEIENIIPDYTHQSQTVVARGRGSHGSVARLADNGLSASSTSTATASPPDGPKPTVALAKASVVPQLTSRMDTYPIDTPTYSSASYPFGGRYSQAGNAGGLSVSAATTMPHSIQTSTTTLQKSAKMVATNNLPGSSDYLTAAKPLQPTAQYLQRSGHQALPKSSSLSGANHHRQQINHHPGNSIQNKHSSTPTLYSSATSATSMSHPLSYSQQQSSAIVGGGGNNLLTSVSTIPATGVPTTSGSSTVNRLVSAAQFQHQQPLYDNQRIVYQRRMNPISS